MKEIGLDYKEKYKDLPITEARPEDAEQILKLKELSYLSVYPNEEYGIDEADVLRMNFQSKDKIEIYKTDLEDKDGEYTDNRKMWTVKDGEKIIAYCSAYKLGSKSLIGDIYVLPSYQNLGVGSRLMEKALDWLGDNNDIRVDVAEYNTPSLALCEKFGFVVTDQKSSMPMGEKRIPTKVLVKPHMQ